MADPGGNQSSPVQEIAALCHSCHQFTSDLWRFDFSQQDTYTPPWFKRDPEENGDFFRHYESFATLCESAKTCRMCYVLQDIFRPMAESKRQGSLGLYPWCRSVHGHRRRSFVAAFGENPRDIGQAGRLGLKGSPHLLKICTRYQWNRDRSFHADSPFDDPKGLFRAVPESSWSPEVFETSRAWMRDCLRDHKECAKGGEDHLPTRVIDIGASETDTPIIYSPKGVRAPYVVLSHCWGGNIPGKTMKDNVAGRHNGLSLEEVPQNFRDAIKITRELGMRYLWIDALCIIQDSADDWRREAANMASIYATATVMISALEADSSTVGILKLERAPLAILGEEYAVQKVLQTLAEDLSACPLNGRGWCMQERLLSPRVLHFGKHQMFWECRVLHFGEDGRQQKDGGTWDDTAGELITWRKRMADQTLADWNLWLRLVEEYSGRRLTNPSDKLPALTGAASAFRRTKGEGHYVAGVWKEDIARGLLWRAHYHHAIGRKVAGPMSSDKCAVLTKPLEHRAPSWSWAALDGRIDFCGPHTIDKPNLLDVLDVEMTVGDNDCSEACPEGRLRVRGPMAAVLYHPPDAGKDVGKLTFNVDDGSEKDSSLNITGCVLDLDRAEPRRCWIITAKVSGSHRSFLVLQEREDGCFTRIGYCSPYQVVVDLERLKDRTIVLV